MPHSKKDIKKSIFCLVAFTWDQDVLIWNSLFFMTVTLSIFTLVFIVYLQKECCVLFISIVHDSIQDAHCKMIESFSRASVCMFEMGSAAGIQGSSNASDNIMNIDYSIIANPVSRRWVPEIWQPITARSIYLGSWQILTPLS